MRDLDALLELDRVARVAHVRKALLTSRVESGDVLIHEHDQRVAGYVAYNEKAFFGRDFVELLVVSDSYRRRGLGSDLLRNALELSTTERVFTSTNRSNAPMIGLLEKAGWQFSGELRGIDEGDPELVYYTNAPQSNG